LVSDEIYHGITYGDRAETVLAYSEHAVVTNGFSKYFAMTGWRLGWVVVPNDLVRPMERLAQNFFISPPAIAQHAAMAVFDCQDELDANVARYSRNRAILLGALPKLGFDDLSPCDGAFYLYADVSRLTNDSETFCERMLAEAGVAITPGIDFDRERGQRFVRFSFAGPTEQIETACASLKHWLGK
jgi:aspartate/methionine/tyrosine aminotransferase